MEKSFKNKNLLVIVFEVLVIALAVGGITFATQRLLNNRTLTEITTGEFNLDYVGDTDIVTSELEPISDNLINYETKDNVIRVEFSLRGVRQNGDEDLIYRYEETVLKIQQFIKIEEHADAHLHFKPEVSINNTQLYTKYPYLKNDIMCIENELHDFLYNFDEFDLKPSNIKTSF